MTIQWALEHDVAYLQEKHKAAALGSHLRAEQSGITFGDAMLSDELNTWQRMKAGDQLALKSVFQMHYAPLCRFAMQWTADKDESEEIVQKLFVDIWEKRNELSIELTLKSYLFAAVRNRCLNYIKHKKVVALHQRNARHESPQLLEISNLDEVSKSLEEAIQSLPEQCQRVFRLVKMDGKKYAEVAEELDISIKTIENHMTKALRVLRIQMRDYLPLLPWLFFVTTKF